MTAIYSVLALCTGGHALDSGDAYIERTGARWTFGTASVRRVVALHEGRFVLESFRNEATHRELAAPGGLSDEFSVSVGEGAERIGGATGGWALVDAHESTLQQGALQLDLTLRREALHMTKSYVIYPQSSIIREWVTFANAGETPLTIVDPAFLNLCVGMGDPATTEFLWMTGGENNPGSWVLQAERLEAGRPRTFDSYDAMRVDATQFPGDGVNAKIVVNDRQVWPAQGWQYVANATVTAPFDLEVEVAAGDKLIFMVSMNQNIGWDTTAFDPTLTYADGETHTASAEFSDQQARQGWQYQYLEGGRFVDLVYYPGPRQWRKAQDNATGTPFIGVGDQHPDVGQDAVRVWTAPKGGQLRITGSVCNTGNGTHLSRGFRMGSSTYAPWCAL
jgi:hypothetical protein